MQKKFLIKNLGQFKGQGVFWDLLSPHVGSSANWWNTIKSSSTRTTNFGLDVNQRTIVAIDWLGNNKKSLDNQGQSSID